MNKKDLSDIRKAIDKLDKEIIKLLSERAEASEEIGRIKNARQKCAYSPDRESKIYSNISKLNKGPLPDDSLKAIYREIMSGCIALERPLKVAFFGPEFTFTHQAAIEKFGSSVEYLSCDSIREVFSEVEKGNADYGVVPIENSTEGAVSHTMDMLVDSSLLISSEVYAKITHHLASKNSSLEGIRSVYSHPQVFGQCRMWLEKNLPKADLKEASSTAKAAALAAGHPKSACISGVLAAERSGLSILASAIQDKAINVTRFLVLGRQMSGVSGEDRTSLVFSVKDRPGVLHEMLAPFKENGINLTKIESRPSKEKLWKYYFFVDLLGHASTPRVKKVLNELETKCNFLKILGSYPRDENGFS